MFCRLVTIIIKIIFLFERANAGPEGLDQRQVIFFLCFSCNQKNSY